jgi:hypothetical protein
VSTVREVGSVSLAARLHGLHPGVVNEWVARGDGCDRDRPWTALYAEFATDVHRAQAGFEIELLDLITAAAKAKPENWRAAAWQLEQFAPERYGGRRFVNMARAMTAQAVEALLGAAVDLVQRSVRPERHEAEVENMLAAAAQIVGGMQR